MVLSGVELPIIIGLVGIGIAVAERTIKTFYEKKQSDPKLQFNLAYLINAMIGSGTSVTVITIITTVVPATIGEIQALPPVPLTIVSAIINFTIGYLGTFRIIDGLNTGTEKKLQLQELKEE